MASDFRKVDAYVNGPADYEESPELTDDFFAFAELKIGDSSTQPDRDSSVPNGTDPQAAISLDPRIIDSFRATGPGWESRINDVLRAWLERQDA